MRHRVSLVLLTSLLSASACTGGEGSFPEDVVLGIESPDGITDLTEQDEFSVYFGPAGGYFLRVWLGGDTALTCSVEDSDSPCKVKLSLKLQDENVIFEGVSGLNSLANPREDGWDFLVLVVVHYPWQVNREIDELFGLDARLSIELLVDGRSADAQEFAGVFTSALNSF